MVHVDRRPGLQLGSRSLIDYEQQKPQPYMLEAFRPEDRGKFTDTTRQLLKYIPAEHFAIVGGPASRHFLAAAGRPVPTRPFHDLDIVMSRAAVEGIQDGFEDDFAVGHWHLPKDRNFFLVLVNNQGVRVDVFDDTNPPGKLVPAEVDGQRVYLQSAEDQLVNTLSELRSITDGDGTLQVKQLQDAISLLPIVDFDETKRLWLSRLEREGLDPERYQFRDTFVRARMYAREHPKRRKIKSPTDHEAELFRGHACNNECVDGHQRFTPITREQYDARLLQRGIPNPLGHAKNESHVTGALQVPVYQQPVL